MVSAGSFPGLRIGTKPAPSLVARMGPIMNPLDSIPMVVDASYVPQRRGKSRNHGVEVELSGDIIDSKGWLWSAGANATFLLSLIHICIRWHSPGGR